MKSAQEIEQDRIKPNNGKDLCVTCSYCLQKSPQFQSVDSFHYACDYLIEANRSGKTSDKCEEREDGDEQQLESVSRKPERVLLFFDIITRGLGLDSGSGRSSQESRDGALLLALKLGKTIVENVVSSALGGYTGLSGFLVVEVRDRISVDCRVDEDRCDGTSGTSSRNLSPSELEVLCLLCERRVPLTFRRSLGLLEDGVDRLHNNERDCEKEEFSIRVCIFDKEKSSNLIRQMFQNCSTHWPSRFRMNMRRASFLFLRTEAFLTALVAGAFPTARVAN
ncbi:unnamed protein product [Pseudo-nitzschia multistriata]|uniref:Uncharacterized protein n=1 Tax=Pseudo-nitzschia multistriata TaxID=183589 RepID=A0A448ZDM9_9STRA|nr:unnamed protein product [Pseudo-nitzschia multistriata]